jgi:hypothetical protein
VPAESGFVVEARDWESVEHRGGAARIIQL